MQKHDTLEATFASIRDTIKAARKYGEELINLKCAPDLLASGVFPNFKELTESFGAFRAIRDHLREIFPLDDREVTCICVGDGSTPRTGATVAFRTAWNVISVDPALSRVTPSSRHLRIERLAVMPFSIETYRSIRSRDPVFKRVVVVAVHSHAPLYQAVLAAEGAEKVAVVAIPCCKKQEVRAELMGPAIPPDIEYDDLGICSPQRRVLVWKDVKGVWSAPQ